MSASLLLGVALILSAPAPKEIPKKESPKIEGEWLIQSAEGGEGKKIENVKFQFVDGKVLVFEGKRDKPEEAKFTVDYTKKPCEINIDPSRGNLKEEQVLGIFEIDGDTLKLCFPKGGGERPKEFKGEGKNVFVTFKRLKTEK